MLQFCVEYWPVFGLIAIISFIILAYFFQARAPSLVILMFMAVYVVSFLIGAIGLTVNLVQWVIAEIKS